MKKKRIKKKKSSFPNLNAPFNQKQWVIFRHSSGMGHECEKKEERERKREYSRKVSIWQGKKEANPSLKILFNPEKSSVVSIFNRINASYPSILHNSFFLVFSFFLFLSFFLSCFLSFHLSFLLACLLFLFFFFFFFCRFLSFFLSCLLACLLTGLLACFLSFFLFFLFV